MFTTESSTMVDVKMFLLLASLSIVDFLLVSGFQKSGSADFLHELFRGNFGFSFINLRLILGVLLLLIVL